MITCSWKRRHVGVGVIFSDYGEGMTRNPKNAWPSIAHLTTNFSKNMAYSYRHLQAERPSESNSGIGHFQYRERMRARLVRNISKRGLNYLRLSPLKNECGRHWNSHHRLFGPCEAKSGPSVGLCPSTSGPDLKQDRSTENG